MAKASIHVKPQKTFSINQANENEREWSLAQYLSKNMDTNHHYDYSRKAINFEVYRKSDGQLGTRPLNSDQSRLCQQLQDRLDELGFKAYKADASNDPNTCVDVVFGGDHDRMAEMAFADQEVAFDLSKDNSHIRRMEEIERWAFDTYKFACDKWGEENVMGMKVHLDETTPHAHILFVPVAVKKQRGRVKPGTERKSKEMVSYCGVFGNTKGERSKYLSEMHTEYFQKVGSKYGLERGTPQEELTEEERRARVHKNASQLEAERQSNLKIAENNKILEKQESSIDENNTIISQQIAKKRSNAKDIADQETTIKNNNTDIARQNSELKNKREEISSISLQFQEMKQQLEDIESEVKNKSKVKAAFEGIRDIFNLGMHKTIRKLKNTLKTAEKGFNDLISKLTAELNLYKTLNKNLEQEKSEMEQAHQKEVRNLKIDKAELQAQVDELRIKNEKLNKYKSTNESLHNEVVADLKKQIDQLKSRADIAESDINSIIRNIKRIYPIAEKYKLTSTEIVNLSRNQRVFVSGIWNEETKDYLTAEMVNGKKDEKIKLYWNSNVGNIMVDNVGGMKAAVITTGSTSYNQIDTWVKRHIATREYIQERDRKEQERLNQGYKSGPRI